MEIGPAAGAPASRARWLSRASRRIADFVVPRRAAAASSSASSEAGSLSERIFIVIPTRRVIRNGPLVTLAEPAPSPIAFAAPAGGGLYGNRRRHAPAGRLVQP